MTRLADLFRWVTGNASVFLVNGLRRLRRDARRYRFLHLELHGALEEDPVRHGLRRLLRGSRPSLIETVELLADAASDPQLEGVLISLGPLEAGWSQVESLSEALNRVRQAGKRVVAFMESADAMDYFLAATSADQIVLHPTGTLHWVGLNAEVTLIGPALAKLGVSVDLEPVGRYKSAVETFTRSTLSDSAREAVASLVDDLFQQLCEGIAKGRRSTPAAMAKLVDQGPFLAREALEAGLVDRLAFADEVLLDLVGEDTKKARRKIVSPHRYPRLKRRARLRLGALPALQVAWIPVLGAIRSGGESNFGSDSGTASTTVVSALRRARETESIQAVLLRVDSPGGSALASDVIWREVDRTRQVKPVVVSMGDHAASGGYYVAAPGTAIVAGRATLTGSIGVFGGKLTVGGLFEKIGIRKDGYSRGANAAMLSSTRRFTRSERKKMKAQLEDCYRVFLERAAGGRHASVDAIAAHAEGRVWTGQQALERGLVDETGGLLKALDVLRRKAEVPADRRIDLVAMQRSRGLMPWLTERLASSSGWSSGRAASIPAAWLALAHDLERPEALAMLPLGIHIR